MLTQDQTSLRRVTLQIGFDGIWGQTQTIRDALVSHADSGIEIDLVHCLVCHETISFLRKYREEDTPPGCVWFGV